MVLSQRVRMTASLIQDHSTALLVNFATNFDSILVKLGHRP